MTVGLPKKVFYMPVGPSNQGGIFMRPKYRRYPRFLLLPASLLVLLLLTVGMAWGSGALQDWVEPLAAGLEKQEPAAVPAVVREKEQGRETKAVEQAGCGPLGNLWLEDWERLLAKAAAETEAVKEPAALEKTPKTQTIKPAPKPAPKPQPKPAPAPPPSTTPPPAPAPEPEPGPDPKPEPEPEPKPYTIDSSGETRMLELINQERQKAGVPPLTMHTKLRELARLKSEDMLVNNYFSHYSQKYGSPFDMMKDHGVLYWSAGENIAKASSVERAHTNLMNSEGHRNNILNPKFDHIGIGIVRCSNTGTYYITQMFIQKR
jgi:uncharacterized YkwD family protein